MADAMILGELKEYTPGFLDAVYKCQLCGLCDVSCKTNMAGMLEPLEILRAIRVKCVEDGQLIPEHTVVIEGLRKEDNMMQKPKVERLKWAEGLKLKDVTKKKAEVLFHAGCRFSYDEELWPVVRTAVDLLRKAGVDIGIHGEEVCCGGRPYTFGYLGELEKYSDHNIRAWKEAGVKTVVTPCAECYHAFKVLYPAIGRKVDIEVLHLTQYIDRLLKEGRIKFTKHVPMTVAYHDPCNLGRLADPYQPWEGVEKKVFAQMVITEPEKPIRFGTKGVYEEPRRILKSIPGLTLIEFERTREYSWCCGAGGGVLEAYPDFAQWTAFERIKEARDIGVEAIVTACPWCERNFKDTIKEKGEKIKIYDIVEIIEKAI